MTSTQITELFGVPYSTLKDWNKPTNKKRNLAKYLKSLDYNKTKKEIEKFDEKEDKNT